MTTANVPHDVDLLLPTQWMHRIGQRRRETGTHRLLMAMLYDAVIVLDQYAGRPERHARILVREAREWFRSESPRPYGFRWVCEHLDLSAAAVRTALAKQGWLGFAQECEWMCGV